MEQKKIWMHYLIIGISTFLVIMLNSSCIKRVDPVKTVNYIYKNQTGVDLVMEVYNSDNEMFKEFNILNGGEVETNTTRYEVPGVFFFSSSLNEQGVSIVIKFSDNKCLSLSKSINSKIFIIKKYDNYSDELMEENKYTLYFTFTEEDYKASLGCD